MFSLEGICAQSIAHAKFVKRRINAVWNSRARPDISLHHEVSIGRSLMTNPKTKVSMVSECVNCAYRGTMGPL